MRARLWTRPVTRASVLALLVALCSACAGFADDIHLAPLYTNISSAGGGRETEVLAGIGRVVRRTPMSDVSEWELHPLLCHDILDGGDSLTRFLVPLGSRRVHGSETVTQLLPLARYQEDHDADGLPSWRLIALPGILWSGDASGKTKRAVFPFGGVVEQFATYDRITFVLFPLYMRTERDGGTFHHVLWPLFSWGHNGQGELDWHFWPLYGVARPGHSESHFALWPLFLWGTDRLHMPREKQIEHRMFFPFYGDASVGSYKAWTALWPFFGYSRDTQSGYWSWDGPWPLVRVQRPGTSTDVAYRTRVWPFYSYFEGDGMKSRWVMWPFYNQREERYSDGSRSAANFVPFYQRWEQYDLDGHSKGSWEKLWPFYQHRVEGRRSRTAFPTLLPTWELPEVDEHYAWIWELYTKTVDGERVHERSWGGLWRRESDEKEVRDYVTGLWSQRKFTDGADHVRETSILFGLLRWRSSRERGFEMMRPALPGPGWPVLRGS